VRLPRLQLVLKPHRFDTSLSNETLGLATVVSLF